MGVRIGESMPNKQTDTKKKNEKRNNAKQKKKWGRKRTKNQWANKNNLNAEKKVERKPRMIEKTP